MSHPSLDALNGDHTGMHLITPIKGKHWLTKKMAAEGENAVKGLPRWQAAVRCVGEPLPRSGHVLKAQVVMAGKTKNSLPFKGKRLFVLAAIMAGASSMMNCCKKQPTRSACFTVDPRAAAGLMSDEGPIDLSGIFWQLVRHVQPLGR